MDLWSVSFFLSCTCPCTLVVVGESGTCYIVQQYIKYMQYSLASSDQFEVRCPSYQLSLAIRLVQPNNAVCQGLKPL